MSKYSEKACDQKYMSHLSSHLFLVRVWLEKNAKGTRDERLCGKVQDVTTGQAYYFRGGSELEKMLRRMIPQSQAKPAGTAKDNEH